MAALLEIGKPKHKDHNIHNQWAALRVTSNQTASPYDLCVGIQILKILVPILLQISWIIQNIPNFLHLDGLEESYGQIIKKIEIKKCQFEQILKSDLFSG